MGQSVSDDFPKTNPIAVEFATWGSSMGQRCGSEYPAPSRHGPGAVRAHTPGLWDNYSLACGVAGSSSRWETTFQRLRGKSRSACRKNSSLFDTLEKWKVT